MAAREFYEFTDYDEHGEEFINIEDDKGNVLPYDFKFQNGDILNLQEMPFDADPERRHHLAHSDGTATYINGNWVNNYVYPEDED